jgi:uncharacterized membrane protein YidH (DUF202 family)
MSAERRGCDRHRMTNESELATAGAPRSGLDILTKVVLVLLALCIALAFVAILAGIDQRALIHRFQSRPYSVSISEARASDHRADVLKALWMALLGVCGVAFAAWTFMQYRRLDDLRDEKRYANWWAISGWLIPVANLFVPFRIVRDIWNATVKRLAERRAIRSGEAGAAGFPIVPVWWALWLLTGFVGFSVNNESSTPSELLAENTAFLVRNVVAIAAGALAVVVVSRIGRAQRDLATARGRSVEETAEVGSNAYLTESSGEGGR